MTPPTRTRVLVVAKAPVPGLAKTRLGADVGLQDAADLAAAALLDTLDACAWFTDRYLALTGDLADACRSEEIAEALTGWTVFQQRGRSFGARLAHAHGWVADDGPGGVVQVGTDTPQLTGALLRTVATRLDDGAEVVLGPAEDGGWWVLGLADPHQAANLVDVAMSETGTFAATLDALTGRGATFTLVERLTDVDTVSDADLVAALAPTTRFARSWILLGAVVS